MALLMGCSSSTPPKPAVVAAKPTISQVRKTNLRELHKAHVRTIKLGETYRLIIPSDALFQGQSVNIRSSYAPVLKTVADLAKTYRTEAIKVAAYSDSQRLLHSPAGRKQALTTRQAQVVVNTLWNQGIDTRVLYASGGSHRQPVAWNGTKQGREYNRRVEISFRFFPRFANYN